MAAVSDIEDFRRKIKECALRPHPMFLSITEDNKYEFQSPHFVNPGRISIMEPFFLNRLLTDAEISAMFKRGPPRQ